MFAVYPLILMNGIAHPYVIQQNLRYVCSDKANRIFFWNKTVAIIRRIDCFNLSAVSKKYFFCYIKTCFCCKMISVTLCFVIPFQWRPLQSIKNLKNCTRMDSKLCQRFKPLFLSFFTHHLLYFFTH